MATVGPRRSMRTRKPVQSLAAEQAAEASTATSSAPTKPSKRKKGKVVNEDDVNEVDDGPPKKRPAKKSKAPKEDSEDQDDEPPAKKKRQSKKGKASEDDYDDVNAVDERDEATDEAPVKKSRSKKSKTKDGAYDSGWTKKGMSVFVADPKMIKEDTSWHAEAAERRNAATQRDIRQLASGEQEKRLRPYVHDPPPTYHSALKKVNKERMFVISRERGTDINCHAHHLDCPNETLDVAGSKGNIYTINIGHIPSCNCPANIFMRKKEQSACKHVLYVLHNVLRVTGNLKQQNAFLTSELKEIFRNAPALPSEQAVEEEFDGNRKPVEGDCPICFMEFEESEEIVWCRAACGNNIHKACLEEWITRSKRTCPYCRSPWEAEVKKSQKVDVAKVNTDVARGAGGYRNVYDQLNYEDEDEE